jgi:hypothetical protein
VGTWALRVARAQYSSCPMGISQPLRDVLIRADAVQVLYIYLIRIYLIPYIYIYLIRMAAYVRYCQEQQRRRETGAWPLIDWY